MKPPLLRLHRQASCRALLLLAAASVSTASICAGSISAGSISADTALAVPQPRQIEPLPIKPLAVGQQIDVGPAPIIHDTSAMDPALVALLVELLAEIEKDQSNAAARAELGLAYEGNTIWSLAEECYGQALELAPDETQWLFRRGVVRFYNGDLDGSIEDLRGTAAVFKNTPVVQARLGDVLRIAGELEESEAAWRHAIVAEQKQTPPARYPASRVGLAQVLLDLEKPEEAALLCEEALTIAPGYKHAHYTLGLALLELGQIEKAELELSAGETAYPEFPPGPHAQKLANYGRGFSRSMMIIENLVGAGNFDEAKKRLDVILVERPDDHMVINLAARVALRSGDSAQARTLLNRSLEAAPDEPSTLIELCLLELDQATRLQAQLASIQQAAQLTPSTSQEELARVQAQITQVQTQGTAATASALAAAQTAAQKAPAVGRHHYWLGVCHQTGAAFATDQNAAGGALQAALASFQMAQRLGCTEPNFNHQLASLYGQMGRGREMLKFALRHLESVPADPNALGLVVQALLSNGKKAEIIPYIKRMEKVSADNVAMLQFSVQAYLTIGEFDSAEAALGHFEAAAAGNPTAAQFVTAVQQHIKTERAKAAPGVGGGDSSGGKR